MEKPIYARVGAENRRFLFKTAADSNQTVTDVLDYMIGFCRETKSFAMPVKTDKALEARQRRLKHYREVAEA